MKPLPLVGVATAVVTALVSVGCGSEPPPRPETKNAALVYAVTTSGSGVYVGDGLFLTNWHNCVNYAQIEVLGDAWPAEQHPRVFNDPGAGAAPHVEGTSFTDTICSAKDAQGRVTVTISPEPVPDCALASYAASFQLDFRAIGATVERREPKRVVYANIGLDLCIMELSATTTAALDADLGPLRIDDAPVTKGRRVVVAGHPAGSPPLIVETCAVVSDAPEPLEDPDTINPSDLVVPTFRVDCKTIAPGSSGSPTFDADTGELLGVIWTGKAAADGQHYDEGYVSAASGWREVATNAPDLHSRLNALLPAR